MGVPQKVLVVSPGLIPSCRGKKETKGRRTNRKKREEESAKEKKSGCRDKRGSVEDMICART